jgi:hypothetical protein
MINEHTLQKLVDGELDNDQIRSLLRDADKLGGDSHPGDWKQMAVAFAENQLIQRSFGDFNSASAVSSPIADDVNIKDSSRSHQSTAADTGSRTVLMALLAASLLIGAALLLHNFSPGSSPTLPPGFAFETVSDSPDTVADLGAQQKRLPPFNEQTLMALAPDHQLNPDQLPATFGRKGQPQVPLYDAKRFDRRQLSQLRNHDNAAKRAWFDQVIPAERVGDQMVADYEKAGVLVDQEIEFLSGRLDDGRSYMIPYRTVRFTPGQ